MPNLIAAERSESADAEFSPEHIRAWLTALPIDDPRGAARALAERLIRFNRAELPVRLRLRLLDMFRDHVEVVLPHLEARLSNLTPPLSGRNRETAYQIEKLLKELAAGYSHVALAVPRAWLAIGFKSQLYPSLVRAMAYHARRLALSQRLYARNPSGVWTHLHELFQLAREWGLVDRVIESPDTSALRVYRSALLLAFAQPTKLLPGEFARAQAYVAAHGAIAEIIPARRVEDPSCVFAIDPRRDRPGIAYSKREDVGYENGDLLLVTTKLVDRLASQLKRVRQGVAPTGLGLPVEAVSPAYQELMERLILHWRGERRPRSARLRFHPRVEVWIGLREIWRLLRAEPSDAPARSSQWIILNESARGFALRYMSGAISPINVGEIVAIRAADRGSVYVCLVRWIQSNNPEHFELGLQQLAPVVIPAVYKPEDTERQAPEPVLFFPGIPAQQRPPSIVAPPNRVRAKESFSLRHRRGRTDVRAARLIEKTPSVEVIEVAPPVDGSAGGDS